MTDGLAVLAAMLLVALSAILWRRWGWPGVVALWSSAAAVVAAAAALLRPPPPRAPSTPSDVHRAREAARHRARESLREAERARQAAERIAADVDAADDAEALTAHLVRRSKGES